MYNGEELIDFHNIDLNDQVVVGRMKSLIDSMFSDADQCLEEEKNYVIGCIDKANNLINKCDVEKIEKRKTIFC